MFQLAFPEIPYEGAVPLLFHTASGLSVKVGQSSYNTFSGNKEHYMDLFVLNLFEGAVGHYSRKTIKAASEDGKEFIRKNYLSFSTPEKAAIIRWVPDIIDYWSCVEYVERRIFGDGFRTRSLPRLSATGCRLSAR